MANSLVGRTLGNYKIIDNLGQGGMATVYLGYQESVQRRVAVKVLPPHPALDAQFIERFQQEARTIASLQHPHILPLYDYGTEDDILYLAMAYIDGGTLEDRVVDGPMPISTTEKMLREIAGALDYAHRRDVIHRDIKPGNILLDSEGHALLADFGIAKISDGANLTGTGIVGTPAYMAPEQAQGLTVDHRIDIYALGVVVYQMLTGVKPFSADTPMQVLVKVMQDDPPDILQIKGDLPAGLSTVMNKVLSKSPDDRYQTASEFAEDFTRAVHQNVDSMAKAKRATPLEEETQAFENLPSRQSTQINPGGSPTQATPSPTDPQGQTIIVQQQGNQLVLLGGFAVIAIALIVVVLLILNNDSSDSTTDVGQNDPPTQAVAGGGDDDTTTTDDDDATVDLEATALAASQLEAESTFGRLTFSTANSLGDSLNLQVEGLRSPPDGSVYEAWMVNTASGDTLRIGRLVLNPLGDSSLTFTDAEGRILPAHFNAVILSVEARDGEAEVPSDEIVYSGNVPVEVLTLLNETLIASEDGLNGGSLLDGARTEARTATSHAGLAARASNVGGMHTHAEHTINILRGEEEDYNGNGRGENPGRGVGVLAFADRIEGLLDTAIASPNANRALQLDGEFLRVCLVNTRQRAERVIELEFELLAETEDNANVEPQAAESLTITESINTGVDLNEDGVVQPFEGECGLDQIETFGILVASMDIIEGDVPDAQAETSDE